MMHHSGFTVLGAGMYGLGRKRRGFRFGFWLRGHKLRVSAAAGEFKALPEEQLVCWDHANLETRTKKKGNHDKTNPC